MPTTESRSFFSRLLLAALLLLQSPFLHAAEELLEFEIDGQARRVLLFVPDAPSAEAAHAGGGVPWAR